ncbi:MAG: hypothetical protein QOG04_187 [Actinomycetota bacterium]|nr:hypothetical protein [Actinomycetota bacterium]
MALAVTWALASLSSATAASSDPGTFSEPFSEPTVDGQSTDEKCITHTEGTESHKECKPAAGTMSVLADGRILYWNALEGTENVKNGIALEFGTVSVNDQTRVLDLSGPTWLMPQPNDAGANPNGTPPEELFPGSASTETYNDGALFCADVVQLPDGRILAIGGTQYYTEGGAVELEGLPNARIFDPETNTWTQTGSMNYGRWYPSTVTLADGDIFVASGVKKLLKPVYPSHAADSGRNVTQTETYDYSTGEWTYNGATADRSLPLYPRLHLLPSGKVFYNAAGQVFNPAGQAYDEATWNIAAVYDPSTKAWSDLGIPGIGTKAPGFRGSTFSIMLPLKPDAEGNYAEASFLTAGGVYGVTPGSYIAHPFSTITTVTNADEMTTREVGDLNNNRWYSTGVLLPDGEVFAVSGASSDEVIGPGTGFPVTEAEMFDPETEEWRTVASQHHARTYHNTAMLLPDGSVLVGGHAPISTLYGFNQTLPGGLFSPNEGRDPTFEIYKPWYFNRSDRPEVVNISERVDYGTAFNVVIDGDTSDIESVVLVRNPSITHLIDGDQRNVELQIVKKEGHMLTVLGPPNGAVAPAGPYMLFVNRRASDGALVPSTSEQIFI